MATVEALTTSDPGTLANNYMFVRGLQSALSTSETNVSSVIGSLDAVIDGDCWRHWLTPEGREVRHNAAEFRKFLEAPRPFGCQTRIEFIRWVLGGASGELNERFEDLIRGHAGDAATFQPRDERGRLCSPFRDDITERQPTILPLPEVSQPRQRDYAREAPTGTSVSYGLRRLKTHQPELAERVIRGELSCYAACVEAGFQDRKITVPHDPARAARILAKHLEPAKVKALIIALADAVGFQLETD